MNDEKDEKRKLLESTIKTREAEVILYEALKASEKFASAFEECRFYMEDLTRPYLNWKDQIDMVRHRSASELMDIYKSDPTLATHAETVQTIFPSGDTYLNMLAAYAIDVFRHGEEIKKDLELLKGKKNKENQENSQNQ